MMRLLFSLAIGLCASLVSAQSPSKGQVRLSKDPKFAAPVTVEMKIAPVGDVIKSISKQAKLSAEPAMGLSDLKLSVFVKQLPAGLVLDKIASVLGCQWINDQGIEILTFSSDEKDARAKYLDKEDVMLRADAEREARAMADAAGTATTFEEFKQNLSKDQPAEDPTAGVPIHFRRPQRAAPSAQLPSPATFALGKLWASYSASDWSDFWNGGITSATVVPEAPAQDGQVRSNPRAPSQFQFVFARYDVNGDHQIQIAIPPHGSIPRVSYDEKGLRPTGELASTAVGKEVLDWPDLSATEKDDAFNQNLPGSPNGEPNGPITLADQLESFHGRSGLPVVADAFRNQVRSDRRVNGSTAASWLASLRDVDQCFVRVEDGVVMVRHGRFWRLRQMEIPESLIQPLAQRTDPLGLMDYANFLFALTPAQAATIASLTPPVLGFPTEQIAYAIPALRFLGALGSAPPSGTPVVYSRLSADARQMFDEAMIQSLFGGGGWEGAGPGTVPARYAFVLRSGDIMDQGKMVPGVTLLFGSSPQDAVTYTVPFPP